MTTATEIITEALHLFGIVDQTEDPTTIDITNNCKVLNTMLRSDHMDGCAQYLMNRVTATLPVGASGSIYSFVFGTGNVGNVDAVAIKAIWCNDIGPTVNRETRQASYSEVVRTTYPSIITKWHQERQVDGTIRVTAWQPPANATPVLIEYGGRIAQITAGTDVVALPPEGIHDVTLMLGRRIMSTYGRNAQDVGIVLQDSEAVDRKWRDWARGQQWLRMVRS